MTDRRSTHRGPRHRALAAGLITLSLAVVAVAQNDLRHRSPDEIRGNKTVWRLASLNAIGALGYLRWGRARSNG